jgi:hypothetical protein
MALLQNLVGARDFCLVADHDHEAPPADFGAAEVALYEARQLLGARRNRRPDAPPAPAAQVNEQSAFASLPVERACQPDGTQTLNGRRRRRGRIWRIVAQVPARRDYAHCTEGEQSGQSESQRSRQAGLHRPARSVAPRGAFVT